MNFTIKLNDHMSGPAKQSASALAQLEKQIKQEQTALAALEKQFKAINQAQVVDIATSRKMRDAIQSKKNWIAVMSEEMFRLGPAQEEATKKTTGLSMALGGVPGVGTAAKISIGLVGAAALAAGATILYMAKSLTELGVAASEARDDVESSLEVTHKTQAGAESTYKAIVEVTNRVAISQARALELSDNLIKAGELNGPRMIKSLEAVGKAEAARAGAGKTVEAVLTRAHQNRMFSVSRAELRQIGVTYKDLAKEISKGAGMAAGEAELRLRAGVLPLKQGVKALQDVIETKLGDIADRKLMSVGHQSQRLKDNFRSLFSQFDTGPLARALKVIADLFDENIEGGSALRSMLKSAFDEIGKAVQAAVPYVEIFFLGMVNMAQKVWIALFPIRKVFRELGLGGKESLASFEDMMLGMGAVAGAVFGTIAKWTAGIIRDWQILVNLGKDILKASEVLDIGVGTAIAKKVGTTIGEGLKKERAEQDARDQGLRVAAGLAAGVEAGTPAVEAAMGRMAQKSKERFDRAMGIHSPSTVMRERGKFMGEGEALGIQDSEPRVIRATQRLADVSSKAQPSSPMSFPGTAPASHGGAPKVEVNFHSGAIVLSGVADPIEALQDKMTELMADVFERAALLQGV